MKYYVTDTHALVWYFGKSKKLPKKIETIFDEALDRKTAIWVPVVVLWELSLLAKRGKIRLNKSLESFVGEVFANSLQLLDLTPEDILLAHALNFSNDPFDTLIVAMTQRLGCPLLTGDTVIQSQQTCDWLWG